MFHLGSFFTKLLLRVFLNSVRHSTIHTFSKLHVKICLWLRWHTSCSICIDYSIIIYLLILAFVWDLILISIRLSIMCDHRVVNVNWMSLIGLLIYNQESLLLLLNIGTDSSRVIHHRFIFTMICSHLLGRTCHVAYCHTTRPNLQWSLTDVRLRLIGTRRGTCSDRPCNYSWRFRSHIWMHFLLLMNCILLALTVL